MRQPHFLKMNKYYYFGMFAGIRLNFAFRHHDSAAYFGKWLLPIDDINEMDKSHIHLIHIPKSDCDCWIQEYGMYDDGNTEFGMSVYRASDYLLKHDRCVIHGAAMLWHGKAWLFVAESGTGKSTQLRHWEKLYPDEIKIMNGDKPILKKEDSGIISVQPSPWKGKEDWGDDSLSAELGGIILLKQGDGNRIVRTSPVYCSARMLSLFFSTFETKETVHALCQFEEAILQIVPVWQLTNLGDLDSARLTHDTLLMEGM